MEKIMANRMIIGLKLIFEQGYSKINSKQRYTSRNGDDKVTSVLVGERWM